MGFADLDQPDAPSPISRSATRVYESEQDWSPVDHGDEQAIASEAPEHEAADLRPTGCRSNEGSCIWYGEGRTESLFDLIQKLLSKPGVALIVPTRRLLEIGRASCRERV